MAHKRRDLGLVTSPILAGVERLVATPLTLNNETPTPIVQLVGVDADGTALATSSAECEPMSVKGQI